MINEILKLVRAKAARRRQSDAERHHWTRMEHAIPRAMAGRLYMRGKDGRPTHEDITMWCLNCAMLINGLSYHWLPLSNRATLSEIKKRKRRKLPKPLHNMMLISPPNQWTRQYASLVGGGWKVP